MCVGKLDPQLYTDLDPTSRYRLKQRTTTHTIAEPSTFRHNL